MKRKRLNRKKIEQAALNLMRLCMQGWVREQVDKAWGAGQARKHVDELCVTLGIRYPG